MPEKYVGNEPFAFISYSHYDEARVRSILTRIQNDGYRIWFDNYIGAGSEWSDDLAKQIKKSDCFIVFLSRAFLASEYCKDELNYAKKYRKSILPIYLENVDLPDGLDLHLNRKQAVTFRDNYTFYRDLYRFRPLARCRIGGVNNSLPGGERVDPGKTSGSKHFLAIAVLVALCVCYFKVHIWSGPTCVEGAECVICGKSPERMTEHVWLPANCSSPEICKDCGTMRGLTLDHLWRSATFEAPETCSACGATRGMSLGMPLSKCRVLNDSQSPKGTDIEVGTAVDNSGIKHDVATTFWVSDAADLVNIEHITYQLSGKFNELSCFIALEDKSHENAGVRFYIYGDGELLYYSSYLRGTDSESFNLDVTGFGELRIECETNEPCSGYGIFDATLYVK